MDNIFRGQWTDKESFIHRVDELEAILQADLLLEPLLPDVVIGAADALCRQINREELLRLLMDQGVPKWSGEAFIQVTLEGLSRDYLQQKVDAELGNRPFIWKPVSETMEEKEQPLGVLMHIGAGNALGLSALSVLEGLLTGNINILKLPTHEGGISSNLLMRLIEIEPRLKPYIYVLDVSSSEVELIRKIMGVSDAVTIWGSDEAIRGIRQIAPTSMPIIEWGHRLSFAYFGRFPEQQVDQEALEGLALDICLTDQLYCSSPQCVFYETDSKEELKSFADQLAHTLEKCDARYPSPVLPAPIRAQITWTQELVRMEEILEEKALIRNADQSFSVMVDYDSGLKASPQYRNIWVMPIERNAVLPMLRKHKGHLQTVGLSCAPEDREELSNLFYASGINRITRLGAMSKTYSGEPHDGMLTLRKYARRVSRSRNVPG